MKKKFTGKETRILKLNRNHQISELRERIEDLPIPPRPILRNSRNAEGDEPVEPERRLSDFFARSPLQEVELDLHRDGEDLPGVEKTGVSRSSQFTKEHRVDNSESIAVSTDDRCKLAGLIMRLFQLWRISSNDKLALLGLDSSDHKLLEDYEHGAPLPDSEEVLKRAGYLLGIHKNLRILYLKNPSLVYDWIKKYNGELGPTPLETMKTGIEGLASIYQFLDSEVNDYKIS